MTMRIGFDFFISRFLKAPTLLAGSFTLLLMLIQCDDPPPWGGGGADGCSPDDTITLGGLVENVFGSPVVDVKVQWAPEDHFEGAVTYTDDKGEFAFDCVPVHHDGILGFRHQDFMPASLTLTTPNRNGVPIAMPMTRPTEVSLYYKAVGLEQDPLRGVIILAVMQSGIKVHISHWDDSPVSQEDAAGPFYNNPTSHLPDLKQEETKSVGLVSGIGGFLNVTPGNYKIWATHEDVICGIHFGDESGPIEISAFPNEISSVVIRDPC